jgi:hypothetical protein
MTHNGFTPSRFIAMLTEDQQYFENTADTLNTITNSKGQPR